ncbi:hypothetical protein BBP40_005872 [Aspergillus hancockii]|nr:hypothetical protein BBP40_005872 [Aspergillus hancockii]
MNQNWTGVEFDLSKIVAMATGLTKDAAKSGANPVVFPEPQFPGYPEGLTDNVSIADHVVNFYRKFLNH